MAAGEAVRAPALLAQLDAHARAAPDKVLFRWLDDKGGEARRVTYAQFEAATARLAAALLARDAWGLKAGDKALLVFPPGLDFIVAFVACLKAGVVAVPVYPPRPGASKDLNMFVSVQKSSGAKVALTNTMYNFAKRAAAFKAFFTGSKTKWPELRWLITDESSVPSTKQSPSEILPAIGPDSLAFFQYTSGSTSAPKGVMVTHGNLAHNLSTIIEALEAPDTTQVVSWLPCYHDMGLIGSLLGVAYCGGSGAYMSPIAFIKSPVLWLEMISKYQATHIQAPNFAYKLVVRKFKERKSGSTKLDLSSLRHIFNAAEPIEVDALDDFQSTFGQFGLSKAAMSPGYGLAEHTVYVCDRGQQRLLVDKVVLEKERRVQVLATGESNSAPSDHSSSTWVVGCGNPHRNSASNGIQVRVVNEDTSQALPEDQVGEVWVDSASKAKGYFGLDDLTREAFHAEIKDESGATTEGDHRWLRTGDLGFFHRDELFICGRIKDLIIIRGRNHYPQDIEHTVEQADAAIRPGCVAAFTTVDSSGTGEHLGVVAEVRDPKAPGMDALAAKLRQKISGEHGVLPFVVVLIKDRSIPKTTSGKISRFRARKALEEGTLQIVYQWQGESKSAQFDAEEDSVEINQAMSSESEELARDSSPSTPSAAGRPAPVPIGSADPRRGNVPTGDNLMAALKDEIARLIEGDPSTVDAEMPLIQLGMDSMALTQFKGILQSTYNTDVGEVELFDEETTLQYVQRRVEGEPPAARFVEDGGEATPAAAGASSAHSARAPAPRPAKHKKRKQSMFGCFKACGC